MDEKQSLQFVYFCSQNFVILLDLNHKNQCLDQIVVGENTEVIFDRIVHRFS